MSKGNVKPTGEDEDREFSRLFWAARNEQNRLRKKSAATDPDCAAALAYAKSHGWQWAEVLLEASRLSRVGESAKALKLLVDAESIVPERWHGHLHFVRGATLADNGETDEAIKAYRKALDCRELDRPGYVWSNLGRALVDKEEMDEAIKAYRKALDDPKYETPGIVWNSLGIALAGKGEVDEAIKAYRKALDDPKYETPGIVWNNLGLALVRKGETDEAIKTYRKALDDPKFDKAGSAWNNLGLALARKGEMEEAIKAYRKALDDQKYDTPSYAWNNLGIALTRKGEVDEAIKAYRKALDDPKFDKAGNAWNNLGLALARKGEMDKAIEAYRKALDDSKYETPGNAWNNLGLALADKGETKEAIKAYRKALEDPKFDKWAKTWANLAQTYANVGNQKDATEAFQKSLASPDPSGGDHARARLGLQMLKSKIGPDALSSDDRALAAKPAGITSADEIEGRIIAAIKEAGDTQYGKYVDKPGSGRDDTLSILRGWSSAVTLLEGSERRWRGGGYFLKWRGCGIVIDPGFDFLRNFHDAGYHGREIGAIIVSHNHPDHNSDLKALDDLRYELYKRRDATKSAALQPYVLLWDQDTGEATKFGFENPEHQHEPIIMGAGFPQPFDLRSHAAKISMRVTPFKVNHGGDVPHAMGMLVELLGKKGEVVLRIGYTADTGYFDDLHKRLQDCDLLIAHISQPGIDELQDISKSKWKEVHLGYRGTAQLLKECNPKLALIGEFWAGFTDLRISLVKGIRQRSGVEAVLPAGLAMHLRLPSLEIECTECKKPTAFLEIKVAPPTDHFGSLAYLCPGCMIG